MTNDWRSDRQRKPSPAAHNGSGSTERGIPAIVAFKVLGEFDAKDPELAKKLRRLTNGGPEVAVECVGKPSVQELALSIIRPTGRLVILGFAAEPMKMSGGRVQYRQLSIIGTLGCRNIDFPVVFNLVKRGVCRSSRW